MLLQSLRVAPKEHRLRTDRDTAKRFSIQRHSDEAPSFL
jgi:hypothetical protein